MPSRILLFAKLQTTSDFRELADVLEAIESADLKTLLVTANKQAARRTHHYQPAMSILNRAIFQRMAEHSPDAVTGWLDQQMEKGNPWESNPLIADALAGLTTHNDGDAERWLAAYSDTEQYHWLVHTLYETQAEKNPEVLLDSLLGSNDDDGIAYSIMSKWAATEPAAAFEWIQAQGDSPMVMGMSMSVFESWLLLDEDAALAAMETLPNDENQLYMKSRYASVLANENPQAAYDWIQAQADDNLRAMATMEIIPMWAEQDITGLIQMIESETDPMVQLDLYSAASHQMVYAKAQENPRDAIQWAESLPDTVQMTTLPAAFENWMYQDPKEAIAWLSTQSDSPTTRLMQNSAMWEMPKHDLDSALKSFPDVNRDTREAIVPVLVAELTKNRPAEVTSFIQSIDHPDVRRIAETAREDLVIVENADAYFAEIETLSGKEKVERMWDIFSALDVHDPERIQQWMAENPLTPFEVQALQQHAMMQDHSSLYGSVRPPPMYDYYRQ